MNPTGDMLNRHFVTVCHGQGTNVAFFCTVADQENQGDQGGKTVDEAEKLKESEPQKDEENKKEKLKSCEEEKESRPLF